MYFFFHFRRISRVSAPGGIMSSGFSILHDQDMHEDTSTDENEFSFNADGDDDDEEIIINETDV